MILEWGFINMNKSISNNLLKRSLFTILGIGCMILLCYWVLYDLGCAFDFGFSIQKGLGIDTWFLHEAVFLPVVCSYVIFPVTSITFFIFYRNECSIGLKILLLLTGIIHAATAIHINTAIFKANSNNTSIIGWQVLFAVYALAAFVLFIWVLISMIKYPKAQ